MGEPRGHWEGNTLVVETTNFIGGKLSISGPPYSEDLVLTERFTRVAPDILEYSVTVNDPKTYTAPWTATFPLTSEPGYEIFEYACHEGNYAMRNRLSAARALEAKDETQQGRNNAMKKLSIGLFLAAIATAQRVSDQGSSRISSTRWTISIRRSRSITTCSG